MIKRICFIGNCQTMALCHFMSQLPSKPICNWLCFNHEWHKAQWSKNTQVFGKEQINRNVFDFTNCMDLLNSADIIIYQPNYQTNNILSNLKNQNIKQLTISPIFINNIDYIIQKETKYNCSIIVSKIIDDNSTKKLYLTKDYHPNTFLYLEILREICNLLDLDFYVDDLYYKILNYTYPSYQ